MHLLCPLAAWAAWAECINSPKNKESMPCRNAGHFFVFLYISDDVCFGFVTAYLKFLYNVI